MDTETKMNAANALVGVSVITCALSIASIIGMLCISTDSPKEMQTDIQVDVLAILVTVLIGWNIFNYMQFKDSMKKIAQEEVKTVTEDYKVVLNGLTMLNGKNAMLAGNFAYLIENSFDALQKILECKNEELSKFAIDYVMDFIYEVSRTEGAEIFRGKRDGYIYILEKISHKNKASIMEFLRTAKETEQEDVDKTHVPMSNEDIDKICK